MPLLNSRAPSDTPYEHYVEMKDGRMDSGYCSIMPIVSGSCVWDSRLYGYSTI